MGTYEAIGGLVQAPGIANAKRGIDVYGHHETFARGSCSSGTLTCDGWATVACNGGAANTDLAFSINTAALGGLVSTEVAGTDNFGLQISIPIPFFPAAGKQIHFRAKIKATTIAGAPNFFMGLSDVITASTTPVLDNATISDVTHAGFYALAGYTLVAASKNDDGGTAETAATGKTLVAATYVVLEVTIIGITKVEFRIDGNVVAILDTYVPDGDHALHMTWCHETDGSTTEAITIPFIECWETV